MVLENSLSPMPLGRNLGAILLLWYEGALMALGCLVHSCRESNEQYAKPSLVCVLNGHQFPDVSIPIKLPADHRAECMGLARHVLSANGTVMASSGIQFSYRLTMIRRIRSDYPPAEYIPDTTASSLFYACPRTSLMTTHLEPYP